MSTQTHTATRTKKKKSKVTRKKLDIDALLGRIVQLFVTHHPSTLTFSKVSQFTKVPRSTLYYYFGKDFKTLVGEAAKYGMKVFTVLYSLEAELKRETPSCGSWEEFQEKRLQDFVKTVCQYPWAPTLYFRYRADPYFFGKIAKNVEDDYIQKFATVWKRYKGTPADERSIRLSAYVKLGLLYGLSVDGNIWETDEPSKILHPLLKKYTGLVTDILENKYLP